MFERKDLLKASFLFLVIFVVMVTLSQILVVHKRNHGNTKSRDRQKMKAIISQIEAIISGMMRPDFIPMDKHTEVLKAIKYAAKIKRQLDKASSMQRKTMRVKLLRSEVPPTSKPAVVNTDVWNLDRKTRYLQFSDMKPSDIHQISQRDDATNLESAVTYGGGSKLTSTVMGALPTHICRPLPENMVGSLRTGIIDTKNYTFYKEYSDIISGGTWQPSECVARQRVAIVIPFRDRQKHLEQLQYNLIPILKRQQLNFRFFVVEQSGNHTFNKGRIMNAAFLEARKFDDFDCFVFHDVDMMPEDDRNMYTCTDAARHMSPAVDKFLYVLPYTQLVGGVLSMKPDVFIAVNGYSNLYWGWGAEDDDMAARLQLKQIGIVRPPLTIGRYRMIKHSEREINPVKVRVYLLKTVKDRFMKDGLNSLEYKTVFVKLTPLYTHIMVDIGEPPRDANKITSLMAKK